MRQNINESADARALRLAQRLIGGCWRETSCAFCYGRGAANALGIISEELDELDIMRLDWELARGYAADFPGSRRRFDLLSRVQAHRRGGWSLASFFDPGSAAQAGECITVRGLLMAINGLFRTRIVFADIT